MVNRTETIQRIEPTLRARVVGRAPAIRLYLGNLIADTNVSPGTIRVYLGAVLRFDDFISSHYHHSAILVTTEELHEYFTDLQSITDENGQQTQASFSRASTTWSALKHFFDFVMNEKMVQENPILKIKKPSQAKDRPKRYFFTPDEIRMLLHTSKSQINERGSPRMWASTIRNHAVLTLLCYTGMRISPALNIDVKDIDWDRRTIQIVEKRDKYYVLKMNKSVFEALIEWDKVRYMFDREWIKSPAFFLGLGGKRLTSQAFSQWLQSLEGKLVAGKHLAPHKLRASFATNALFSQGKGIYEVKEMMHHASVKTTEIYLVGHGQIEEEASQMSEEMYG